jgi:hypothetical protein
MKERITEQELRRDLLEARLLPGKGARSARIHSAVTSIAGSGSVFFVLTDTPEQTSDILRVLVDDRIIVAFELDRRDSEVPPREVRIYTVEEYRRELGNDLAEAELRIATELARRELNR